MQAQAQAQAQKHIYAVHYVCNKTKQKFVTYTKHCTKAQALDAWEDFNCFNTFTLAKLVATNLTTMPLY